MQSPLPSDARELTELTNAVFEQVPRFKVMLGGVPRQTLIYSREERYRRVISNPIPILQTVLSKPVTSKSHTRLREKSCLSLFGLGCLISYKLGQGDQANARSVPDGAHETGLRDFAILMREEEGALV